MLRALLLGLAAAAAGLSADLLAGPEALARGGGGFQAGHGAPRAGPVLGRFPHRAPFVGGRFHGPARFHGGRHRYGYPYGYGYPLGLYPPLGGAWPAGLGAEGFEPAPPARPMVPEAVGIRPQPVGTPTLTLITSEGRTGRSRARVYEAAPGEAAEAGASPGPRLVRVRVPQGR